MSDVASVASIAPLFLLVDGHSLAFRSYFAYAKSRDGGLRTTTGIPTSVCFGFLKTLLETVSQEQPTALAIAFDLADPTFRHEADATYKEGRPEPPEDFIPDLENLQQMLRAMQLPIMTAKGFEADDLLGTMAQQASRAGYRVKILTGDRDLFQLVSQEQQITVLYLSGAYAQRAASAGPTEFGPAEVRAKLGIDPTQVVDYKALCGDPSDNIPGVKGIGEKTAVQLLTTHGSLDQIYAALANIKGAVKQKLDQGREAAFHSQFMAQIHLDAPLEIAPSHCHLQGFPLTAIAPWLERLEICDRTLVARLEQLAAGHHLVKPEIAAATGNSNRSLEPDLDFFTAEETAMEQQSAFQVHPEIVNTPEQLAALVHKLHSCTQVGLPTAWDTETTALEPKDAALVGLGCCFATGDIADPIAIEGRFPCHTVYIPIGHKTGQNLDCQTVLQALRPVLESAQHPKVLHNAKFDRLILDYQGIQLQGVVSDTLLASYLLNPEANHTLSELSLRYLNIQGRSYSELVPKGQTIADLPIPEVAEYCGLDAYSTFHLHQALLPELQAQPEVYRLLTEVEVPLEQVLAAMEKIGIRIDQAYLQEFSQNLERDLQAIEQRAYQSAGETFNLGSPKQLSELMFDKLKLDRKKSRKIKTGYSTDAATLEKLQGDHPVVDAILEHRILAKLKSTYVDALPALVHPRSHRLHTDFNQAVTATGRLSSSNPNLQNIPIRTEFSRQIRKAFVPEPGWLMVTADYSQIELRILAHLSQEPILLETYQQNRDVHTLTAQMLLDRTEITPDERRMGKIINFGVIYGMGAQRFAREMGVSLQEAKGFIERFNDRYANVFTYLQQKEREALAQGYVTTILGRRRYFQFNSDHLKALRGRDPQEIDLQKIKTDQYEAQALRAAANAPIQGSSADIIKVAMVQLHQTLQEYQARMLLQVHDELVFEMPREEWPVLQPIIRSTMETAILSLVPLTVPLVVDIRAGQNWMDAK